MARTLEPVQIAEIVAAIKALPEIREVKDMLLIPAAFRANPITAFSAEDLVVMEAGIAALQQPLGERATWRASPGRGHFFVFEGLDRSGKSTQSRLLRESLEKVGAADSVRWMCFPNRSTASGCLIDLYLRRQVELSDGVVHLLFSANRWEMAQAIVEDLGRGTSVVCDRYAFSGVAYSAAKGLDFDWCQAPDRGLPCPDGIFFMRVDPKVGASRANFGDERYENEVMQANVRSEFSQQRLHDGVNWFIVDGAQDIQEIHEEIQGKVAAVAEAGKCGPMPIGRLWMQ